MSAEKDELAYTMEKTIREKEKELNTILLSQDKNKEDHIKNLLPYRQGEHNSLIFKQTNIYKNEIGPNFIMENFNERKKSSNLKLTGFVFAEMATLGIVSYTTGHTHITHTEAVILLIAICFIYINSINNVRNILQNL